ncbi:MAG: L,D-transpeptidase, partial [Sphingomonadaceae bacterium]
MAQDAPENLLPDQEAPVIAADKVTDDSLAVPVRAQMPTPAQTPAVEAGQQWSVADAQALIAAIENIDKEGLDPADYRLMELRMAIAGGPGDALNKAAGESFTWVVEDLRDGRTPMEARRQWFVVDPDPDLMPTSSLMAEALSTHDIAGVLASLAPINPEYAQLKEALANTPKSEAKKRKLIRANMDRWRWLQQDLGTQYLITNVPEYQLRLVVKDKI